MIRDEILNMPAGREMDLLIDDKVFGMVNLSTGKLLESDLLPNYSTDLSAAWEVMEKFSVFNFEFCRENGKGSACAIVNENLDNAVIADAVPLAICRAALLAVMK